jgi:hypothetical protein
LTLVQAISSMATTVGLKGTIERETKCDEERMGEDFLGVAEDGPLVQMVYRQSLKRQVGGGNVFVSGQMELLFLWVILERWWGLSICLIWRRMKSNLKFSSYKMWLMEKEKSWRIVTHYQLYPWQSMWVRSTSLVSPRWVVKRVKGFDKVVELSCDRFEDKLMTLLKRLKLLEIKR